MADLSTPTPRTWPDALAALPDATPPTDGWARVARALDAEPERREVRSRRWPLWLAAAGVAALAVAPMLPRVADDTPTTPASMVLAAPASAPAPATANAIEGEVAVASVGRAGTAAMTGSRDARAAPGVAADPPVTATPGVGRARTLAARPVQTRGDDAPPAHRGDRGADDRTPTGTDPRTPATAMATIDSPHDSGAQAGVGELVALQAESARLEALVALASDERVGSASGVVLAAGLQDRVGLIDAALSQVDLDYAERVALWQQRVATLRDLAGIESTQRWLAMQGERYDGALVRID